MKNRLHSYKKGVFLLLLTTAVLGCSKKDNPTPPPTKPTITLGVYMVTKEERKQPDGSYQTQTLTDCEAAEFYNFSSGSFQGDSQSCGVAVTGTWSFNSSTSTLTVIDSSTNQNYLQGPVTNLSSSGFVLTDNVHSVRLTFVTAN